MICVLTCSSRESLVPAPHNGGGYGEQRDGHGNNDNPGRGGVRRAARPHNERGVRPAHGGGQERVGVLGGARRVVRGHPQLVISTRLQLVTDTQTKVGEYEKDRVGLRKTLFACDVKRKNITVTILPYSCILMSDFDCPIPILAKKMACK